MNNSTLQQAQLVESIEKEIRNLEAVLTRLKKQQRIEEHKLRTMCHHETYHPESQKENYMVCDVCRFIFPVKSRCNDQA